jgi:hypothetical protein
LLGKIWLAAFRGSAFDGKQLYLCEVTHDYPR